MKSKRTWVLIADAGRARILETTDVPHTLAPVPGMSFEHKVPRTHDLVSDRQPRSQESANPARHAIEKRTDPRQKVKLHFIEEIAGLLEEKARDKAFDRLVIAAPPSSLGALRDLISDHVRPLVAEEIAKDLTKTPDREIPGMLSIVL